MSDLIGRFLHGMFQVLKSLVELDWSDNPTGP